ncbi:hypothetical protein ATO12_05505 [Aquimarina atlantica]|uniref:Uncharacterized protein n=1 Tax=Aquimarina atlantica TaxID=1317122 RepID=A0A023BP22_9FLAO|nr:hypothetical protein [Aquimarina atlantica]EZH71835.1 hypothetical protein ATO12_05505 [Aquimarina atlantica]
MKKIIEISGDNNTVTLEQEGNIQATYIKVYNLKKRLIRHSRSSGNRFQFTASPGKYILETDGKLKLVEESKKDLSQPLKEIYKHLEIDEPNNMLRLKGIPFYQTDDVKTFIGRMVKDKKELQGYLEAHQERDIEKARKKIFSDSRVLEVMAGGGTAEEKTTVKKELESFNKEKLRISNELKKAKTTTEMLNITPKFTKLAFNKTEGIKKSAQVTKKTTRTAAAKKTSRTTARRKKSE